MILIACPTLGCAAPAEVVEVEHDALRHSRCAAGHDHALAPPVLDYLVLCATVGVDECGVPAGDALTRTRDA